MEWDCRINISDSTIIRNKNNIEWDYLKKYYEKVD